MDSYLFVGLSWGVLVAFWVALGFLWELLGVFGGHFGAFGWSVPAFFWFYVGKRETLKSVVLLKEIHAFRGTGELVGAIL